MEEALKNFSQFEVSIRDGFLPAACLLSEGKLYEYYKKACQFCLAVRGYLIRRKQTKSALYQAANDCYERLWYEYRDEHDLDSNRLPISVKDHTGHMLKNSMNDYLTFLATTREIRVESF